MSLVYSPLCDIDVRAYIAYCYSYGTGTIAVGGVGWGKGDEGHCGGRIDADGGVDVAACTVCGSRETWRADACIQRFIDGVQSAGDCGVKTGCQKSGVVRVSVGSVSGDVCGDGSGDGGLVADGDSEVTCGDSDASVLKEGISGASKERVREKKNKPGKKMRERLARKARRGVPTGSWRGEEVKSDAQKTLEEKWVLENRLAKVKLEKDLEFQQRRDVNAEVRCNQAKMLKRTEQDKVAVEKAYSTLKETGNVAGFCETVVSGAGSTGTISPHSSVSEKDVWELNKRVEDLELENAQLKRQHKLGRVELGETVAFTLDEHGAVPESLMDKFEGFNDRDHELVVDIDGGLFDKREKFRPNTVVLKKKVIPCADDFDW